MIGDRDEQGFSLVELLVVIILFGVISALVSASIIRALQSQQESTSRGTALSELKTAVARIGREVRGATDVLTAQDGKLSFTEDDGTKLRTMTYQLVTTAGTTKLTLIESDASYAGASLGTKPTRTVIDNLVNTSSVAVFSYLGTGDDSCVSGALPVVATAPNAYDTSCVGSVVVHFQRRPAHSGVAVDFSDIIDLRNA
jgi:prepilin-type N-terminal cleavage/methylation domain-containing protein